MTMTDPDRPLPPETLEALETALAELRADAPPPPDLVARVLADAAREARAGARRAAPADSPPARRGLRALAGRLPIPARLGMPAGLTAALLVGLWIGAQPPAPLQAPLHRLETALFGPVLLLDFADAAELLEP